MDTQCPFCSPASSEVVFQNPHCYARYDRFPVSNGHLLIVPFRHSASFFDFTAEEREAALDLVWQANAKLDRDLHPDGYNVGVNVGLAAGQTIMHAHIHVIPRYRGDAPDPRGGVRFVIPHKATYWDDAPSPSGKPQRWK